MLKKSHFPNFNLRSLNKFCLWLPFLLCACRLPQEMSINEPVKLPGSYEFLSDSVSTSTELPEWREIFLDEQLVALIDTALVSNIDMRQAIMRIQATRANLNYAKQSFLPSVDATAALGSTRFGDYTVDGVGNFDTNLSQNISDDQIIPNPVPDYLLGLQAHLELGVTGKLKHKKRAAVSRLMESETMRHHLQTILVAEVGKYYYHLVVIENELKVIAENISLQRQALELADIQKRSGQINELAVKQFHVQLLQTQALEATKEQQYRQITNELNALLGRLPQEFEVADTLDVDRQLATIELGIPVQLIQRRPDIKAAELQLRASESELAAARASFYPSIRLGAFFGLNGFNPAYLLNPASLAYTGVAGIANPLLNRNVLKKDFLSAGAERKSAFNNYRQTVVQGISEVDTHYNNLKTLSEVIAYERTQVGELKEATTIASNLFRSGYANYLEVLMVRRNLLNAEIELLETQRAFFNGYLDLYRVLGGGWQ